MTCLIGYDFDDCLVALSNETREQILAFLSDREMSVNELTAHFTATQPTISYHLSILRHARLVTSRRDKRQIFYSANPQCMVECCREIRARFSPDLGKCEQTRRI